MLEDGVVEDAGEPFGGDGFGGGDDGDVFGEAVDEEDEGVVAAGGEGKVGDEVHGDGVPGGIGDGEGLEETGGGGGGAVFIGLARGTGGDVLSYVAGEARPIEMAGESGDGFGGTLVTGDRDIVGLLDECRAMGRGDVEAMVGGVE